MQEWMEGPRGDGLLEFQPGVWLITISLRLEVCDLDLPLVLQLARLQEGGCLFWTPLSVVPAQMA